MCVWGGELYDPALLGEGARCKVDAWGRIQESGEETRMRRPGTPTPAPALQGGGGGEMAGLAASSPGSFEGMPCLPVSN